MAAALPLVPWSKHDVCNERNSTLVTEAVGTTALDLFALGFPTQANRLLTSLYEAGSGMLFGRDQILPIYSAWEAYSATPGWVYRNHDNEIWNGDSDDLNFKEAKEKIGDTWEGELGAKFPNFTESDLSTAIEKLKIVSEEDEEDSTTLGMCIEIGIQIGDAVKAKELVDKNLAEMYKALRPTGQDQKTGEEEQLLSARKQVFEQSLCIWDVLKDGRSGEQLRVNEEAVEEFVDEGCQAIEERFTKGPARPYADRSIEELVRIMDESYVAARIADPEAGEHMSVLGGDRGADDDEDGDSDDPEDDSEDNRSHEEYKPRDGWAEPYTAWRENSTFLTAGLTSSQMITLEASLSHPTENDTDPQADCPILLPNDYQSFLRLTDGFHPGEPDNATAIFFGHEHISRNEDDAELVEGLDFVLFPYTETVDMLGGDDDDIDRIPFPEDPFMINIGPGGNEGHIWLFEPCTVQTLLSDFETAYTEASPRDKKIYERMALDLYGGIDKLRRMEWLLCVWYHWDPDQRVYGGFKEYLEDAAVYAVRRREEDERDAVEKRRKRNGLKRKRTGEEGDGGSEDEMDEGGEGV